MKNGRLRGKLALKALKEELADKFHKDTPITTLTHQLVNKIDEILIQIFHQYELHTNRSFCLIALGSYGRRELQLYSDIDLLLIHEESPKQEDLQRAQAFIQHCWDIGLEVKHQITTVKACSSLASQDLSVISSLLDMHLVCGAQSLMEALLYETHPLHMWPSNVYFYAKRDEQKDRYIKYEETTYNLEPNVKNGPGGLRDIHILLNISKRHFGIETLKEAIFSGFITEKEYEELIHCQHFLWKVRFALHLLANKQEDRLLFDYQIKLAQWFGFKDDERSLAIEQFMKSYFKVVKRIRELNEMLLQWFIEVIIHHQKQQIVPLDASFQLANDYIEVKQPTLFRKQPAALLELFIWIVKRKDIKGIRATTIRLIREHLYLIGKKFRSQKIIRLLFLNLFRLTNNPYHCLKLMNRYGVLGHYIECFGLVTGQMQYDLFHVYTVDQHSLFVIRNLGRFLKPTYQKDFPLAALLMNQIKKPDILYLAALFHDIAKGRGGDHSELGAQEVNHFAQQHDLSNEDSQLLVWLVKNHLFMSKTAQQQDIYNPKTIHQFIQLFPHPDYLDYLYLLTIADICATNPKLWNCWKDSLLKELYHGARFALKSKDFDETTLIDSRKNEALLALNALGFSKETIIALWSNFIARYFLQKPSQVIVKQTAAILSCNQFPLVLISPHYSQGGIEIFIYMPHCDERFMITTTILSNYHTTIQEAAILTCTNNYDLDSYIVLNKDHQAFLDHYQIEAIKNALFKALSNPKDLPLILKKRISQTHAHFKLKPQISFSDDEHMTRLFLIMSDRPGLLASLSRVFYKKNILLHNAKITTAGERVEDMFFITTKEGYFLAEEAKHDLKQGLLAEFS